MVETVTTSTYDVRGMTAGAVRSDINARRGAAAGNYDARTNWSVSWHYFYRQSGDRCEIGTVTVKLAITYTLPRLETADAALAESFERYLVKLREHEDGHADNGRGVARRIDDAIRALAPEARCDALGQDADAAARAIIADGNRNDVEYDARTQNGRTQGARWP